MPDAKGWFRGLTGRSKPVPADDAAPPVVRRSMPNWTSFASGNDTFAVALYGQLRQTAGNLFFSPFSIRTVLAMPYAGARGDTAAELADVLHFSSEEEALHVEFGAMIARLNAKGAGTVETIVANSLWCQDGVPLRDDFEDLSARYYTGGLNVVDFSRAAEAARRINAWVAENTRGCIRNLVDQDSLRADTRLVLVNAAYFTGEWVEPFKKSHTRSEPFHLEEGGSVDAPLMHQRQSMHYAETPHCQAVELFYRGGDFSMIVLLPWRTDGLADLEARLSAEMIRDCAAQMLVVDVKLALPRFEFALPPVDMRRDLEALGLRLPFSRTADFSGMNGHNPSDPDALAVSGIVHAARVEVNETGSEAAAATATGAERTSAGPNPPPPPPLPVFRADHPFLFAIRDRPSGAIVFLGRVTRP